jgi:hypothetical protein
MKQHAEELMARSRDLPDELEEEYRQARLEFALKRAELAEDFLRQQKRYRAGLLGCLFRTRLLVVLTSPLVYLGWIPFLVIDLFVTFFRPSACRFTAFPKFGVPTTWCWPHGSAQSEHHPKFFDYGDAAAFRQGRERLRQQYEGAEADAPSTAEKTQAPGT